MPKIPLYDVTFDFVEVWKIFIFANFTCIWPFWRKLSKIVTFDVWKYLCLIGIHKYLWDLENKFQNIFQILGHMLQNMASYGKKSKKTHMRTFGILQIKKLIFLKVADIVREIDIWPENGILGVLEWFGSLIWYLESSRTNFEKIEKNRIFWIFDLWVTTMSGSKFRPIGRKSAE